MRCKSQINEHIERSKAKYPVIKKLEDKGVIEFEDGGSDGIYATECCDNWFWCALSAEEVLQLSEFFKELAAAMRSEQIEEKMPGAITGNK